MLQNKPVGWCGSHINSPRCPALSAVSGAEPPPHSAATQIDAEAVTAPGATDGAEMQQRVPLQFYPSAMSTFPVSTHMGHMFLIVRHATGYWRVSFLQRPSGSTATIFPSGRLSVISQSQVHIPPRRNLHRGSWPIIALQYAAHARRSGGGGRGETASSGFGYAQARCKLRCICVASTLQKVFGPHRPVALHRPFT